MDTQVVWDQLAALEDRGLVRASRQENDRTVRFKHALVREATYGSILTSRRAELHRDVAEAIQELFPNRDPVMTLTLAEHWFNAHDLKQMIAELLPHGQELVFSGHGAALLQLLDRITPIQIADPDQLNELGKTFYYLSAFARSLEFNRACLAIAEKSGDVALQARAANGVGLALWNLSEFTEAEVLLKRSRELSIQTGDHLTLANVEFNLANVFRDRGVYPRAIEAAEHARALYAELGQNVLLANTYLILGTCYYSAGDYDHAASYYELARKSSRELDDVRGLAVGLCNLAELEETLGRYEQSATHYSEAIIQAELLMNDYLLAFAKAGLAQVRLHQGQPEEAMTSAEGARDAAARMNSNERLGAAHRVLAEIYVAQGDAARANTEARRAVDLLERVGHALELKRAYGTYGRILSASADPDSRRLGANYLQQARQGD